ncbi:MAG: pyridoxal phosphate-dependent aminotransferase [Deltaproteobacteria bacterium]|jgi:aspartate aminotransferase|nr:pyridoxal phosphate-dependent aminotransferase [Deltaproteobacteria bacterium]
MLHPHPLAQRTLNVKPSPTLTLDAEVKAMKAKGSRIVNLGVGEPDFETPDFIKEAAIQAIRDGFTRYTPSEGILELREAVARKFSEDNGLDYDPGEIVITCGGKHALYNVMQALFGPGDEVIIPAPYWVTYPPQVLLAGATPVLAETRESEGYVLTPDALEKALTKRSRGIVINSPSNPTGMVYSRENLLALAPAIEAAGLWVISDDIYETLVYNGRVFVNMPMACPELKGQTVICHGVSKTYSMTGWRIGFLAAPQQVAKTVTMIQSQMTSNPCSIAQKAGLAALTGPREPLGRMRDIFDSRRKLALKLLGGIPGFRTPVPAGAFYVFPDVSAILGREIAGRAVCSSDDLAAVLLRECEVATVPGSGFGAEGAIRFSYAASEEEISEGLGRIARLLATEARPLPAA